MGSENNQFRFLNIVRLQGHGLHHDGCRPPRYHATSIIQLTKMKTIADGVLFAGAPLFDQGEWFLDSRYRMRDIDLNKLPRGPEDKITVYRVGPRGRGEEAPDRTTAPEDYHCYHGGLYYVGKEAMKFLLALRSRTQELFEGLSVFEDTVASTRRYPYGVRILQSQWDKPDAIKLLKETFEEKYKEWAPDVKVVMSPGGIRHGHFAVLDSVEYGQPVLVIDPDFLPHGDPALMYELKGEERQYTHMWHVRNPINGLQYGHGSPKLICRPFFDMTNEGEDMTLSCSTKGVTMHETLVGTHCFTTSPLSVFKTTLREVYKLKKLAMQGNVEAEERLAQWVLCADPERAVVRAFSEPYQLGVKYGLQRAEDLLDIDINNYEALTDLGFQNQIEE